MQELVLEPLHMSSSGFVWRDDYEDRIAQGHDGTGSPVDKRRSAQANVACSPRATLYGQIFGGEQPAITWLNRLYLQK